MYRMLLKVYYSSFSAFTACTFDWLIDVRSLTKIIIKIIIIIIIAIIIIITIIIIIIIK